MGPFVSAWYYDRVARSARAFCTREPKRRSHIRSAWVALSFLILSPAAANAGMPSFTLTDIARMRTQTISFFLFGFLLSSLLIQLLWNYLRRDFSFLPRLGYGKAVGVVFLWGLLFVLVLTMISGARELMTPGAWEKKGFTYRLTANVEQKPADETVDPERQAKLEELRRALWQYADTHRGQFPPDRSGPEIPKEKWQMPDPSGLQYMYVSGPAASKDAKLLAFEPEFFGSTRLVLLSNGEIRRMDSAEISRELSRGTP
jgi:hypothetical protein